MILGLTLGLGLIIILIAFVAEYFDSSLGMGYGTSLTPILLLLGFAPLQIVPSILFSELFTGLFAGFTHHSVGNVDFKPRTLSVRKIFKGIKNHGVLGSAKKGLPFALKLSLFIGAFSIIGTLIAVFIAVNLSKFWLTLYIGILITTIGILILLTLNKKYSFSWERVTLLSAVASFNKGVSGGGYGPVVTGGQLLAGVNEKNAVAITSLAEALTCLVGMSAYIFFLGGFDWILAPYLLIGALLSVPLSAITVKKIQAKNFKKGIGMATTLLGILTLSKLI